MTRNIIRVCVLFLVVSLCRGEDLENGEPPILENEIVAQFSLFMKTPSTTPAPTTTPEPTTTPAPAPTTTPEPITVTIQPTTQTTTEPTETTESLTTDALTTPAPPPFVEVDDTFEESDGVAVEAVAVPVAEEVVIIQQAVDIPLSTVDEIKPWLIDRFDNSTGYMSLDITSYHPMTTNAPNETDFEPIMYTVTYDISALSAGGALCAVDHVDCLESQLNRIKGEILADTTTFPGGLIIDTALTDTQMTEEIRIVSSENLVDPCQTQQACADANNTCFVYDGTLMCPTICNLYNNQTNPTCTSPDTDPAEIIFLKGVCVYSSEGTPQCDCGSSPGDVVSNFYINDTCVSSAFVIGMAAGLGGFLIVLLLIIAICCGCKRDKKKKKKNAHSIDGYKHGDKDTMIHAESGRHSPTSGFTNIGYDAHSSSNMYPDFQANLTHIDPKADYSIRRPSLRKNADYNGGVVQFDYESIRL